MIQEIICALNAAKYDDSNLVMFSGLGNVFCSGIDLHYLSTGDRKTAARNMVDALRYARFFMLLCVVLGYRLFMFLQICFRNHLPQICCMLERN